MRKRYFVRSEFGILRPRQSGRHFAGDIFKCTSMNENVWISIHITLMSIPKGPIDDMPTLVQKMAWHRTGDKMAFGLVSSTYQMVAVRSRHGPWNSLMWTNFRAATFHARDGNLWCRPGAVPPVTKFVTCSFRANLFMWQLALWWFPVFSGMQTISGAHGRVGVHGARVLCMWQWWVGSAVFSVV